MEVTNRARIAAGDDRPRPRDDRSPGAVARLLGPRIPRRELREHRRRYLLPAALFITAAAVLVASIPLPYWNLSLDAPQYPEGLSMQAYVDHLEGDVEELEGLNHYVGLPSFEEGAKLERSLAVIGIIVLSGLLLGSLLIHNRWVLLLTLPALTFPIIFLVDLQYWLWRYGHSLDPAAPFSGAVGEFTPPVLGPAEIAQFETFALPGLGFGMAVLASALVATGLWFHRRAYKPLVENDASPDAR